MMITQHRDTDSHVGAWQAVNQPLPQTDAPFPTSMHTPARSDAHRIAMARLVPKAIIG
jgi:hypothetical protein